MVTDKIKELENARAKLAALEQSLVGQLRSELAGLPAKFGFDSVAAFISAVKAASDGRRGRRGRSAGGERGPGRPPGSGSGKRRRRAVITEATRANVKKLV